MYGQPFRYNTYSSEKMTSDKTACPADRYSSLMDLRSRNQLSTASHAATHPAMLSNSINTGLEAESSWC